MQSQQEINQLKSQDLIPQSQAYNWTTHEEAIKDLVKYAGEIIRIKRIDDPLLSEFIRADGIPDSLNLEFVKKLYSGIINTKEIYVLSEKLSAKEFPEYYNIMRLATFYALDLNIFNNGHKTKRKFIAAEKANNHFYTSSNFKGALFLPIGLILKKGIDLEKVTDIDLQTGKLVINQHKFNQEYEKILLPYWMVVSQNALKQGTQAVLTAVDIGCGWFSGEFKGKGLEGNLDGAMRYILKNFAGQLQGIKLVQKENGMKGTDNKPFEEEYNGIYFRRAEGMQGLLNKPEHWGLNEEEKEEFKQYPLSASPAGDYKAIAGNEMNADKPAYDTSEPAFAAATDVAARITGIKTAGYNVKHKCFIPKDVGLSGTPTKFYNVYDKLRAAGEQLKVDNDNTTVLVDNKLVTLDEAISKYIDIYINTNQTISKIHTESQEEEKVQEGIPRSDSFANYVTKIEGSSLHRQ
jgi:hypothetical protein